MAARESLRFDLTVDDRASGAFSRVGRSVQEFSAKMDGAAFRAQGLDEVLKSQRKTLDATSGAALALARSDGILDEVQRRLRDGALEAEFALKREKEALKDVKREAGRLDGTRAKVKVEVDRSAWSRIGALFGHGGGGAGGAGGASGAGQGLSLLGLPLSNPYVLAGTGIAATLAAPVAAQGLAGLLALGLGGGLAGLGIAGAFGTGKAPSQLQLTAAQLRLTAAQDNLARLQGSAKTTPGQLASAQASVATARDTLSKLQASAIDPAQAKMRASFASLTQDVQDSLAQIGRPMRPVMDSIFKTATGTIDKLTPTFVNAEKTISGPFKTFSDTLLNAFTQPAVKQSIGSVATSFGKLLTALTPQLGGDVAQVADGISRIMRSVSDHPQAFADLVKGFFKITGVVLDGVSALANFGGYLQQHFWPAMHRTSVIFDGFRHETAHVWDDLSSALIRTWRATWNDSIGVLVRFEGHAFAIFADFRHRTAVVFDGVRGELGRAWNRTWDDTLGATIRQGHNVEARFDSFRHYVAGAFDSLRHDVAFIWDRTWGALLAREIQGGTITVNWLKGLPGKMLSALGLAGKVLSGWGAGVLQGVVDGARTVWNSVVGFFKGLPGDILHVLGIHSPPQWAIDAGKHIMNGIGIGLGKAMGKVTGVLGSITGISGSGSAANALGGLTGSFGNEKAYAASLLGGWGWSPMQMQWLIPLWQRESGWNPWAVNPGSGAYGIPQALGHGHPFNLGDWKAQIQWGLAYIFGRYGSPLAAEQHEIAAGWYDRGGFLPPGLSLAYNGTGRPEPVGAAAGHGQMIINVNVGPGVVNGREVGRQIADYLAQFKRGGGMVWKPGGF